MGQEAFDIEDCVQEKNKRKGDINMLRKTKRTLSLVLALIMICSTMGVMAFAANVPPYWCEICKDEVTATGILRPQSQWTLDRIVECPEHPYHDAGVYYAPVDFYCDECGNWVYIDYVIRYVCLND